MLDQAESQLLTDGGTLLEPILPALPGKRWKHEFRKLYNHQERRTLRARYAGICLSTVLASLGEGDGLYGMKTDCAYLGDASDGFPKCEIYDEAGRPRICARAKVGEYSCREAIKMSQVSIDSDLITTRRPNPLAA